jgi:hypothetical protein
VFTASVTNETADASGTIVLTASVTNEPANAYSQFLPER